MIDKKQMELMPCNNTILEQSADFISSNTPPKDKTLQLVLKYKWFDMIASGEKLEEYRELKPYWWKRIMSSPYNETTDLDKLSRGYYDSKNTHVRFRRGYRKNAPEMIWKLGFVGIGQAKPEWSEETMGRVIVLELQKRISFKCKASERYLFEKR